MLPADDVDKRGRKVNQTSGDDLRKYYHLEGDSDKGDSPDEQCLDEEVPNNQESDEEAPSNQESDEESELEGLSGCDQVCVCVCVCVCVSGNKRVCSGDP